MHREDGTVLTVYRDEFGRRKNFKFAADDLGVTIQHLSQVIDKGRESKSLWKRIAEVHPELLNPELWNRKQKEPTHA